ncbi:MAG: tRNA guanosine(34) transglycosylase Tgt [Planctomycetota bacterium]|nr:MAG: tRNA guanosine(34) transglycosylase Tgt [Planctomycetota bacterium]
MQYNLLHKDKDSSARRGQFTTAHGTVQTPAFMPVGTQGAIKTVTPDHIEKTGSEVVLANTYHLNLEGRSDLVKRIGGLHKFMGWKKTILTDSGGFQVFSIPNKEVVEEGVFFPADNNKKLFLGPKESMEIQKKLGADIVMAFDECVEYPTTKEYVQKSIEKTTRWGKVCRDFELQEHQFLFGIIQGGTYLDLRAKSAKQLIELDFDGYAIGGVSVGEGLELLMNIVHHTAPLLPVDQPRYLMGVGLPEDIFASVQQGMDMFDCIIPTKFGRGGTFFTSFGKVRIMEDRYRKDRYPPDTSCECYTCQNFSRLYLRHLFLAKEPLGMTLASIHNIHFYQNMMKNIRVSIEENNFMKFQHEFLESYFQHRQDKNKLLKRQFSDPKSFGN